MQLAILAKAPGRAEDSKTVTHILMVDDQDEKAADIRRHHGFNALPDSPQTVRRPWQRSGGLRQQLQTGSNLPQSSYLISRGHIAEATTKYVGWWVGPESDFLLGVKRTNTSRDVRGALPVLAYALEKEWTNAQARQVLSQSKPSPARLDMALNRLRTIVKDGIGRGLLVFFRVLPVFQASSAPICLGKSMAPCSTRTIRTSVACGR